MKDASPRRGPARRGLAGLGQVTVSAAALFSQTVNVGQDNEGATSAYSLAVVGGGVTNLFSTNMLPSPQLQSSRLSFLLDKKKKKKKSSHLYDHSFIY